MSRGCSKIISGTEGKRYIFFNRHKKIKWTDLLQNTEEASQQHVKMVKNEKLNYLHESFL